MILPPLVFPGGTLRAELHARTSRKCGRAEFSLFTGQREREKETERYILRECVCACEREREREREKCTIWLFNLFHCF